MADDTLPSLDCIPSLVFHFKENIQNTPRVSKTHWETLDKGLSWQSSLPWKSHTTVVSILTCAECNLPLKSYWITLLQVTLVYSLLYWKQFFKVITPSTDTMLNFAWVQADYRELTTRAMSLLNAYLYLLSIAETHSMIMSKPWSHSLVTIWQIKVPAPKNYPYKKMTVILTFGLLFIFDGLRYSSKTSTTHIYVTDSQTQFASG